MREQYYRAKFATKLLCFLRKILWSKRNILNYIEFCSNLAMNSSLREDGCMNVGAPHAKNNLGKNIATSNIFNAFRKNLL